MTVPSVAERLVRAVRKRKIEELNPTQQTAMPASGDGPLVHMQSRCEDDDIPVATAATHHRTKQPRKSSFGGSSSSSTSGTSRPTYRSSAFEAAHHDQDDESMDEMVSGVAPMSPRVRKRLDEAKENATVFQPVCEQGEVIQWMTACHPNLRPFGAALERRGYTTLSSIAFLTEDDVDASIDLPTKQLLLATLARLRHELFRM